MENPLPAKIIDYSRSPQPLHSYDYGYSDDGLQRNRIFDYWYVLVKRKWLILCVFIGIFLSVGINVYLKTPIYRATAMLQIIQDNTLAMIGERDPFANLPGQDSQSRFYETQYMLLTSRPIAQHIMESLNLKAKPEFKKISQLMEEQNKSPEEITSALTNNFLSKLEIIPLKKSSLVEISYESPDRHVAKEVANAFYKEYVNLSVTTRQQSYVLIQDWLQSELVKLANKVTLSEKQLYDYGKKKKFIAIEGEDKDNVIVLKYAELSMLLTKAEAERSKKEAQFHQLNDKRADTSLVTDNPLIQKLRQEAIAQEAKVSSLSETYDINFPGLQGEKAKLNELRSRLNNEVKRIRDSIAADYRAALATENLLRQELEVQKGKVADLQDNMVEHRVLKRDMKANEQLYQALLARTKEVSVASTMVASNVAVIAPAELPLAPYKPNKLLNLSLAIAIGLIAGISLAFLMEYFDKSIRTSKELEKACGIPFLGIIPLLSNKMNDSKGKKEMGLVTFKEPGSPISIAIYHILTSIKLSGSDKTPRVILITSPNPNDGKTTVSINLASALAACGQKVVFVDADLRKPNAHVFFQQPLEPGLTNFLTGSAPKEEIIRPTFIPNLYFIPGGDISLNPIPLLTSSAFDDFLKGLRNEFHHIIIDSPPIIGFADGRIISTMTDGVLMVLRHHYTSRESGHLAIQFLEQVNSRIFGGVLNMADKDKLGYGGYDEYSRQLSKLDGYR